MGMKRTLLLLITAACLRAETHNLTLKQAIDLALNQNTDLIIARIESQKAELAVRVARDPFSPKLVVGSGAAYTTGYPQSIEGSAPSIVQARTIMSIYNQPQKYLVAQARENMRTSTIDENMKRDDVAFRTASLFLDVLRIEQSRELATKQIDSYAKVLEIVQARVTEGRELPITAKQADFNVTRARQRAEILGLDADYGEASLSLVLGFGSDDRVHPVDTDVAIPDVPVDEDRAVQDALANSKEIRRLESQLMAKTFEVKSYRSARLPVVDLVAQYALLAQYAYVDFFRRFQRNNGQLGVSIQLPVLAGTGSAAQAYRSEADVSRVRTEINSTRDRIAVETRKAFKDIHRAQLVRDVARGDLDLTREQLSVTLAQMNEGRAALRDVEALRSAESEKWIAFYDAQHGVEKAELNLLRQTGTLVAALR
jgi:outer membrane protein